MADDLDWSRVNVDDLEALATYHEQDIEKFGKMIEDTARGCGISPEEAVEQEVESLKGIILQELKDNGLGRSAWYRCRHLTLADLLARADKTKPRNRAKQQELRIINAKAVKNWSFIDRVVLSVLCSNGVGLTPYHEVWRATHQSRHWSEDPKYKAFVEQVQESARSVEHLLYTEGAEQVVEVAPEGLRLRMVPDLWVVARSKGGLVRIPCGILGGPSHLGWLPKIYLAYRVRRAEEPHDLKPTVLLSTLEQVAVEQVSVRKAEGYMRWLECQGVVGKVTVADGKIAWEVKA